MNILSIDTSTGNLSLALNEDDQVLSSRSIRCERKMADKLIPEVDQFLKKSKTTIHQLDGFVVGLGPGSFTGLRVGVSAVKAMAFALNKPVVGVSSLDALAQGCPSDHVCVICDARRGMVYSAQYEKTHEGGLNRLEEYRLMDLDSVFENIQRDATVLVGDACALYAKEIKQKGFQIAPSKYFSVEARHLAALAVARFQNKDFDDVHALTPLYLYAQDCQVIGKKDHA